MSILIYVHGTNGSGKSTLARKILDRFGKGEVFNMDGPDFKKVTYTETLLPELVMAGKYANACGGVDGISPYAAVYDVMKRHSAEGKSVFAEGLITPGIESCRKFAQAFDNHLFIHLATPIETCIAQVEQRRMDAENYKDFDPTNLLKKRKSAESWARRMKAENFQMETLTFNEAYERIVAAIYSEHSLDW